MLEPKFLYHVGDSDNQEGYVEAGVVMPSSNIHPWGDVVEWYAGVVKELFLLPQVIGNALWRVNYKPLAGRMWARSPLEPERVRAFREMAWFFCARRELGRPLLRLRHALAEHQRHVDDDQANWQADRMLSSLQMRTRAAVVEWCVGGVKECFLLAQYAGLATVWLLPRVYGYLRPPVVNTYCSGARDDVMDFYSKASAVVVPVVYV
nr:unnamed protein product [Digitaria exilis]